MFSLVLREFLCGKSQPGSSQAWRSRVPTVLAVFVTHPSPDIPPGHFHRCSPLTQRCSCFISPSCSPGEGAEQGTATLPPLGAVPDCHQRCALITALIGRCWNTSVTHLPAHREQLGKVGQNPVGNVLTTGCESGFPFLPSQCCIPNLLLVCYH